MGLKTAEECIACMGESETGAICRKQSEPEERFDRSKGQGNRN